MNKTSHIVALIVTLLCGAFAIAQDEQRPVVWSLSAKSAKAKPLKAGDKFTAILKALLAEGWHVYSITQPPGGPTPTVISVPVGQPFRLDGKIGAPKPERVTDRNFDMETELYSDSASFSLPLVVATQTPSGAQELTVNVLFQACNGRSCLPPTTVSVKTSVTLAAGAPTTPRPPTHIK